ncbi:hypothetical protein AGMMS49975_02580 [Clostridia bacterium]|nr:hypothetical protein AGMMS49975_02580 [Clostridia bacterium]
MNKVILMGRLTRDPEVRYSQGDEPVAITSYTLAVNKRFKRENEPDADFIPCKALGKSGEFAGKYFKKGQQVAVSGRISVRQYEDKAGNRQYFTEVIAEDQYFADSKNSGGGVPSSPDLSDDYYVSAAKAQSDTSKKTAPKGFNEVEDTLSDAELPF